VDLLQVYCYGGLINPSFASATLYLTLIIITRSFALYLEIPGSRTCTIPPPHITQLYVVLCLLQILPAISPVALISAVSLGVLMTRLSNDDRIHPPAEEALHLSLTYGRDNLPL
jgi:hypothetical protein